MFFVLLAQKCTWLEIYTQNTDESYQVREEAWSVTYPEDRAYSVSAPSEGCNQAPAK